MKKSMKIVLLALLLLANCGILFAQQAWLELGDKYFDQFAYKKAIKLYEGAIERGLDNWEINAKLGDCYYNTSDLKTALKYYEKAIGINNAIN
jgi:tetratricopeptide (TPR) repeat protein